MSIWPRQRDCDAFYGNPRSNDPTQAAASWKKANLVRVGQLPFVMRYAGQPVTSVVCHRKVADAFRSVLDGVWRRSGCDQRVVDDWGMSVFSGSYNYRLMRGLNVLSMHSYGCAFDFDAPRNALHDRTPHFAQCPEVLAAWKQAGAVWGSDWNGNGSAADEPRADGMHFQFATL
ncbi:hypothetical protein GCM10007036_14620 [Alsobacter metallidurans]|uniref:Peptidase M15C domain-containing protein n=1 Tax=Alsobacter metallidurans TaxID=340221 RepID=A0A917MJ29_9HYPH|nr:M15 family metallopeptidase [Alsobacter metallidurans]GGH14958.1 hypothetical protein GCM10007036_14620 [Alsobacter metallidurans]